MAGYNLPRGLGTKDWDHQVRLAAFNFLAQQAQVHGDNLPRRELEKGFLFHDHRVPLIGPQGIFKPAVLPEMPISITTAPPVPGARRPYDDKEGPDGLWRYKYRGTDPRHPDNVGLRKAMQRGVPLIYFVGIEPGLYLAAWPAYIVADDPGDLSFSVAVDDPKLALREPLLTADTVDSALNARRQYITVETRQRLHQRSFRERVIRAYQERCAICRLRHQELLEAAHILPDSHPKGEPVIPNGIALCKLHHAAFDRNILGIRPDLVVELRLDILQEEDGPMLKWGLQHFQGASIHVPRAMELRPEKEFLQERYAAFRSA